MYSKSKMSSSEAVVGCFVVIGLLIFVIAARALLVGYVLSTMWSWFVMSYFELPELSIPRAIGFALIAGMFVLRPPESNDENKNTKLFISYLSPIFSLFMAWLVMFFM